MKYLQSTSQSDYVPNINTFLGEKCGIIVTVGFLMGAGDAEARREETRRSNFAIVDERLQLAGDQATSTPLVFNTAQDGFLGGYLAAGMTKTGKVATFGGMQHPAP